MIEHVSIDCTNICLNFLVNVATKINLNEIQCNFTIYFCYSIQTKIWPSMSTNQISLTSPTPRNDGDAKDNEGTIMT